MQLIGINMKKRLAIITMALISFSAQAESNFYAFGSYSKEHLRYDVKAWKQQELNKDNRQQILEIFQLAGGDLTTKTDLTSLSHKFGLGYQFSSKSSVEFSIRNYPLNSIGINANISGNVQNSTASYNGHNVSLTAKADGMYDLSANLEGKGYGLSLVYKINKTFFVRGGVEYVVAKYKELSNEDYHYQYKATYDNVSYIDSQSFFQTTSNNKIYHQPLPLIGAGADFPITKNLTLRAEFEHIGIIKEGFDFYSATLVYKF